MSSGQRALYLDCFSGISGDMFLGALIDVGVPLEVLNGGLAQLGLPELPRVEVSRQTRSSISGVRVEVKEGGSGHEHGHGDEAAGGGHGADPHDPHGHHRGGEGGHGHGHGRAFREIRELLQGSSLAEGVRERSLAMFGKIAEAEAKIHGTVPEEVHFHEVGAVDSIADVVGAALALDYLRPEVIRASALREGTGFVRCAHGTFPLPAPATAEILRGIPLSQCAVPHELITPTGAAILAVCVESFGPLEGMAVERIGYGLGLRDLAEQPNVLRAMWGTVGSKVEAAERTEGEGVEVVETNLDDVTPEELALACELVLGAGALDVVVLPATMKKGRPGWMVQVLGRPGEGRRLAGVLLRETSAFGVRMFPARRMVLSRRSETVETRYGPLPIKLGFWEGKLVQARPEFEPARRAADRFGVALHEVYAAVLEKRPVDQGGGEG
ncbi:MAG: nickel pincer cofactor biosynthesis protein LarC [Verrucomicrobiia bacterium]